MIQHSGALCRTLLYTMCSKAQAHIFVCLWVFDILDSRQLPGLVAGSFLGKIFLACKFLLHTTEIEWLAQSRPAGFVQRHDYTLTIACSLAWCLNIYQTQYPSPEINLPLITCRFCRLPVAWIILGSLSAGRDFTQNSFGHPKQSLKILARTVYL